MRLTRLNCAMALAFGPLCLAGPIGALAGGLPDASSSLTGTVTLGSTQSSPGPSFDLTTTQSFYTSLSPPFSSYAIGDLSQGVMSVQGVTSPDVAASGSASSTFTETFTNTGSTAQAYNFNFYIGSGSLVTLPVFNYPSGPGSVSAELGANIALNGQSLWSYNATLSGSATGAYSGEAFNLVTSSPALTFAQGTIQDGFGDAVTFNPYQGSIALGTLAAGQSEQLTYTLFGDSFSQAGSGGLAFYGGALAQIGDPFSVEGQGITTFGVTPSSVVSAVPEAGTNTMLASGLLLLGGLALKRRRNLDARRTRIGKGPSITLA
jgi:hypothetical protein